ncbi:MAG TPA: aquaporin [Streptosporangiaceae bacterium]|nr:aquaporin [Streptosporangiaceae bacterium]
MIDANMARKYTAELIGTGILVFFGAGMATISFGFRAFGGSVAAGILLTGLTFGLVLLGLVAVIGPISGCHVNPAVTLGQFLAKRISPIDAVGYVIAQLIGALLGALLLLWVFHTSPFYIRSRIGLGANGYGNLSLLHASGGGAFLIEIIITAVFVLVVLSATRARANVAIQGAVLGVALALVNIMGIAIDGASVNPARSFGPAIVAGGPWLSQLWLFLIAPLVGAVLAAGVFMLFHPGEGVAMSDLGMRRMRAQSAMTVSGADEQVPPAGTAVRSGTGTPAASQPAGSETARGGGATGPGGTPSGDPDDPTGPVNPPGSTRNPPGDAK